MTQKQLENSANMKMVNFEDILQGDCFCYGHGRNYYNFICLQRVPQGLIVLQCDNKKSSIEYKSFANFRGMKCCLLSLSKKGFKDLT